MHWNIRVLKKRPLEPTNINNKPILVECRALITVTTLHPSHKQNSFWDNYRGWIPDCKRIIPFLTSSKPTTRWSFTCGIFPIHLMAPNIESPFGPGPSTTVPSSKPWGTSPFFWSSSPENNKTVWWKWLNERSHLQKPLSLLYFLHSLNVLAPVESGFKPFHFGMIGLWWLVPLPKK